MEFDNNSLFGKKKKKEKRIETLNTTMSYSSMFSGGHLKTVILLDIKADKTKEKKPSVYTAYLQ